MTEIKYKTNTNVTELFDLKFAPLEKIRDEEAGEDFYYTGFTVFLKRAPRTHLMITYVPTGVLTIISSIGFMIPVNMVPGRMALLVTIFLMLVNIITMAIHRGPVVSNRSS